MREERERRKKGKGRRKNERIRKDKGKGKEKEVKREKSKGIHKNTHTTHPTLPTYIPKRCKEKGTKKKT